MQMSHKIKVAVAAAVAMAVSGIAIPGSTATPQTTVSASQQVVASKSSGTIDSKVVGTFGKNGTVRGSFVPERSFVIKGQPYVQGTLKATLRRGDGTLVGRTTRDDVTLPLAGGSGSAPAKATCTILHLVLGPLDLNLLGLKVHLDKVVLDITAQTGSGNLLGNLLCAIAGLLDNTSPTPLQLFKLSSLLNRIIGILT